jgi:glutamyl-tRNA reductase
VEFREELFIAESLIHDRLLATKNAFSLKELFALSTCNRVELFFVGDPSDHKRGAEILSFFVNKETVQQKDILPSSHFFSDAQAIQHMMKVTASLDSVVVGETQITGQIKDAAEIARSAKCLGPILGRLFQESLAVSKRIRSETSIGSKTVSISHTALDLAKMIFTDLSETKILIIGSGEMARIAAKYAYSYNPVSLTLCNRTIEKAKSITTEIGGGFAVGLEDLDHELTSADIVITATSSPQYIVSLKKFRALAPKRRRRVLFMVDIAIPRDIDPDIRLCDDVYLFDVDDLKQVVDENLEERKEAAKKAEVMIDQGSLEFQDWLDKLHVKPTLASFHVFLNDLFLKELEKTLSKEMFSRLEAEHRLALTSMMEATARKLSSKAAKTIHETDSNDFRAELTEALRQIFLEKE